MIVFDAGFSKTTSGGLTLIGSRNGSSVGCSFSGEDSIRCSSFSNRRILSISLPPGNRVRRLGLDLLLTSVSSNRPWSLPGNRVFRLNFKSMVDGVGELHCRHFAVCIQVVSTFA